MERPFLILILLVLPLFGGTNYPNYEKLQKNFIFWVQINTKNNVINHQNLAISQSMRKYKDLYLLCDIRLDKKDLKNLLSSKNILDSQNAFYNLILSKKDEIFDCLNFDDIRVSDTLKSSSFNTSSNTSLNMLPLNFSVELEDEMMLIYGKD